MIKVKVEVEKGLGRQSCCQMLNNNGAENRFPTSRNPTKPQKGMLSFLPFEESISLQKPKACTFLALLQGVVIVRGWIWRRQPTFDLFTPLIESQIFENILCVLNIAADLVYAFLNLNIVNK